MIYVLQNSTFRKSSVPSRKYRDEPHKVLFNDQRLSKTETDSFSENMETPTAIESLVSFNTKLSSNESNGCQLSNNIFYL